MTAVPAEPTCATAFEGFNTADPDMRFLSEDELDSAETDGKDSEAASR